jgi:hypothetical protein
VILGKLAQRAIRGNGALWQKADTSSVFGRDPQRAMPKEMATCGKNLEKNPQLWWFGFVMARSGSRRRMVARC